MTKYTNKSKRVIAIPNGPTIAPGKDGEISDEAAAGPYAALQIRTKRLVKTKAKAKAKAEPIEEETPGDLPEHPTE